MRLLFLLLRRVGGLFDYLGYKSQFGCYFLCLLALCRLWRIIVFIMIGIVTLSVQQDVFLPPRHYFFYRPCFSIHLMPVVRLISSGVTPDILIQRLTVG